jgi:hypothetical protein
MVKTRQQNIQVIDPQNPSEILGSAFSPRQPAFAGTVLAGLRKLT